MTPPLSRYRCSHCGKVVARNSDKAWVKSYCDNANRVVHLMRVTPKPPLSLRSEIPVFSEHTPIPSASE